MAVIYADVGARHQRQQAVATQIRLQYMESKQSQKQQNNQNSN